MTETSMPTEKEILQKNLDQCRTWAKRAGMAMQQKNTDLTKQALQRAGQYQEAAAEILELESPPAPQSPQDVMDWLLEAAPIIRSKIWNYPDEPEPPKDRGQPSRVPLKPLPTSGVGAIALPEPSDEEDFKDPER